MKKTKEELRKKRDLFDQAKKEFMDKRDQFDQAKETLQKIKDAQEQFVKIINESYFEVLDEIGKNETLYWVTLKSKK